MIHLDTHVVAWLYEGIVEVFPPRVVERLEREALVISPIVELELEYLHEIGRIAVGGRRVVSDLESRIGLARSDAPFSRVIDEATQLRWTRDPFDRLIVANAHVDGAPLLTRDETIRSNVPTALWDGTSSRRGRRSKRP